MAAADNENSRKRNFHHPFEPYDVQNQFMNAVYDSLESGKVGILESPTGTGKSLSLICGSLTWLRDYKSRDFTKEDLEENTGEEPEWILLHDRTRRREAAIKARKELEIRLAKVREKEESARIKYEAGEPPMKRTRRNDSNGSEDEEAKFLLDDYESDDGREDGKVQTISDGDGFSSKTKILMEKLGMTMKAPEEEDDTEIGDGTKIYYCSRTHSQLSQFAKELQRVKLPAVMYPDLTNTISVLDSRKDSSIEELKHLTLGSRKNLCINEKVSKLQNTTMINERCLELQQSDTSKEHKCAYLPSKDSETLLNEFRDHTLAKIRDIEDLGKLGRKIGVCPYYASRATIKPAEIITLPYPLMLQKSAREALNISLKNHVVIIDEAHNLMDAITNIYSTSITLAQIYQSRTQLGIYLQKFRQRLKGTNRIYLAQLVRLMDSLALFLTNKKTLEEQSDGEVNIGDLLTGKGLDQINLYKLMHYLQESKLARKVDGYALYREQQRDPVVQKKSQNPIAIRSTSTPCLMHIQSFLYALTFPEAEGRFFYSKGSPVSPDTEDEVTLKYLLLDPTHQFKDIVEDARAVLLVGGTMSPMSDYTNHLLGYLPPERITTLSCGHVIPASNLFASAVAKGPNGVEFDFTFEKRKSEIMINDLGQALLQFARTIPDGLVVFLPSHAYLLTVKTTFQYSKGSESVYDLLSQKKRVFFESSTEQSPAEFRNTKSKVEGLLSAYTEHIATGQGGILFAVIGGSLSEGINFSDALGRGVVVVGLPFPNSRAPEWRAKLKYIEGKHNNLKDPKTASKEFYENACMRAVNQTIGRAIRHKADFAAILLLDKRYKRDNIKLKLPNWIKASLSENLAAFEDTSNAIEHFFRTKTL